MNNKFKKNINIPNYWNWNGFKICWSVTGEENEIPIIFLHGFGASRKHWRNNLEYFAKKNFASYSLDLIGFGDSDQPGIRQIGKLNNEIWCDQVKDFIQKHPHQLNDYVRVSTPGDRRGVNSPIGYYSG